MKFFLLALFALGSCTKERYEDAATLTDDLLHELEKRLDNLHLDYTSSEEVQQNDPEFTETDNSIIKTSESLKDGAIFLGSPDLATKQLCQNECLKNWTCNLAVFKIKNDETSCYLFNCMKPSVCSFVNHSGFSTSYLPERDTVRKGVSSENDLEHLAATKLDTTTLTTTTTTEKPTTTTTTTTVQTEPPRRVPVPLFSECRSHKDCAGPYTQCLAGYCVCQESYHPQDGICRLDCKTFEFECANTGQPLEYPQCVAIYHKCDGITHCHDGSDELNCPKEAPTASGGRSDKPSNTGIITDPDSADPAMQQSQNNAGNPSNYRPYFDPESNRNRVINNQNSPYYDMPNFPDVSYYDTDYRNQGHISLPNSGDPSKAFPIANSQINHYGQSGGESQKHFPDGSASRVLQTNSNVEINRARPVQTNPQAERQPPPVYWNQPKVQGPPAPQRQEPIAAQPSTPEKALSRGRSYPTERPPPERQVNNRPIMSGPESAGSQPPHEQIHDYNQYNNHPHQIQRKPGVENVKPPVNEHRKIVGNEQKQQLVQGNWPNNNKNNNLQQKPGPYLKNTQEERTGYQSGQNTDIRNPLVDKPPVIINTNNGARNRPGGYPSNGNNYNNFNSMPGQQQNPHSQMYPAVPSQNLNSQNVHKEILPHQELHGEGSNNMNAGRQYRPLTNNNNNRMEYQSSEVFTTPRPIVKPVTEKTRVVQPSYQSNSNNNINNNKNQVKSHHRYSTEGGTVQGRTDNESPRKSNVWPDSGRSDNDRLTPYNTNMNRYPQPNIDYSDNSYNRPSDNYWNSPYFSSSNTKINNNNNNNGGGVLGNMYHYYDQSADNQNRGYFAHPDYTYYNFDQGLPSYNPFVFGSSLNPPWESQKSQASARNNALAGVGSPGSSSAQQPGKTENQGGNSRKVASDSSGVMDHNPSHPVEKSDEKDDSKSIENSHKGNVPNTHKSDENSNPQETSQEVDKTSSEEKSSEKEEKGPMSSSDSVHSSSLENNDHKVEEEPKVVEEDAKDDDNDDNNNNSNAESKGTLTGPTDKTSAESSRPEPQPKESIQVIEVEENGSVVGVAVDENGMDTGVAVVVEANKGAVVALSLGLAITFLLLFFVGCRLRNVRKRLRRGRPMNSNEADYLINGMYL